MPPEITLPQNPVQSRTSVAAPDLSAEVSAAVSARAARRAATGEVSDPELANTLAELPGAHAQSLGKYDLRKAEAVKVSNLFSDGGRVDVAVKVAECAPYLKLSQRSRGERWKAETVTCKVRECPMCDARQSAKRSDRLSKAVAILQARHRSMRWLLLTLTVRNCALSDLRMTIIGVNAAWRRMLARKELALHSQSEGKGFVYGWSRAVEVTRSADGTAHPHAHVLLGVSSSYFKGTNYLSQNAWRDLWRACARLDYDPVVDVRSIKKPSEADGVDRLAGAILEVTKAAGYSVKAAQLQFDDRWLCELHEQQSALHFFTAGGELKEILKEIDASDDEDADLFDEDEPQASDDLLRKLHFSWRAQASQYRRSR